METLIVQPKNKKQLSAVRAVLKALDVSFQEAKEDDTAYLSRSEANKQALNKSIKQVESGQTVKVDVFC